MIVETCNGRENLIIHIVKTPTRYSSVFRGLSYRELNVPKVCLRTRDVV